MWCSWLLHRSRLHLMSNKGHSCLTNPACSTVCIWSTAVWIAGTALENTCIHSLLHSCSPVPFLRIEATMQSKAVTNLGFWVVKNHGMKTEDGDDRGRKLFPDSIGQTSLRSLFLTLDGNDKPVSQVSSTMTGLIWRPNYMWHHDELLVEAFILIIFSEIIFDKPLTIDLLP